MSTPHRRGVGLTMGVQAGSDVAEAHGSSSSPRLAFASIWAYAFGAGLVALGLAAAITAFTQPSGLRVSLQWATIPVVAVVAGLACESTLARLYSLVGSHHHETFTRRGPEVVHLPERQ
jgi:hypothetical protein